MRTISQTYTRTALTAFGLSCMMFASSAFANVVNHNITEAEVTKAQQAWGKALIQISEDFGKGGLPLATQTAKSVLDQAYGYNLGPVLFKPTLTSGEQTFRTSYEGEIGRAHV